MTALNQAFMEHDLRLTEIGLEPLFNPLRADPSFIDFQKSSRPSCSQNTLSAKSPMHSSTAFWPVDRQYGNNRAVFPAPRGPDRNVRISRNQIKTWNACNE
jgi:hypothetical protein